MVSLLVFVATIFLSTAQEVDACSWFYAKDCYYNPGCHIVDGLCVTDPCWEVSSTETPVTQCSKGPACKYHVYTNNFVVNEQPMSYPIEYCTTGDRFVHDFCHLYYSRSDIFVNTRCTYMSPMPGCGSTHEITLTDGDDITFCTRNGLVPYDTHDTCELFSAKDCKYNPGCEVAGGVCIPDRCFEDLATPQEVTRGCILGNQCTVHSLTVNSKDYKYCTNGSRDDEVDLCHSVWNTPSNFNETECFGLLGGNWCKGKVTITVNETPITFCTKEYIPSDGGDKGKKKNVAAAIVIPIVVVVVVVVVVIVIVVVVKRKQGYKNLSDGSNTYLK